ncbi:MAG: PaaI family thioesterase [Methanobacterium sp.]|jgi:acyl-CoA thioesterase
MKIEELREFFKRDEFAAYCDIKIVDISPGYAKTEMLITENHLNGVKTVHGGTLFTLADFAFAVAANSHGNVTVAINVSITFMKAVNKGKITAEARELSSNPKLATYTVDISDEEGDLVAVFQGLAYRKKDTLQSLMDK